MPTAAELIVRIKTEGTRQAAGELDSLGRKVDQSGAQSQKAAGGFKAFNQRVLEVQSSARAAQSATANVATETERAGKNADAAGKRFQGLTQGIAGLSPVALGTAGAVTGVGLALKSTVDSAIAWESALAGVAKTVDASDAEILALGDAIRVLALEIPISAVELAGLAEAAGALGIAREDILDFVEVTALIGTTTDVSADMAATSLGQLGNVLDLTADDYERFGSALVQLGNDGASTESAILGIVTRAGAGAELLGFATDETLAWSAALANLGIETEAAGSSAQTFFIGMLEHVSAAGDELAIIAETAGMTSGAFAQAFGQDASAALATFIEGLGQLAEAEQLAVLEALGFNDVRITRALLGLAGNTDNLTASLETSEQAWRDNTAMAEEAGKRFATSASQIQLAKNEMRESAIVLGQELAPAFVTVIQGAAEATDILTKLAIMLKETGKAAVEVSGGGPSGGAGLSDFLSGLESGFRIASGGSQDLEHDFKNLANTLLLGRPALEGNTEAATEMGGVFEGVAGVIRDTFEMFTMHGPTLGELMGAAGQSTEAWAEQLLSVRGQIRDLTEEQAEMIDLQLLEENMLHDISAATGLYASNLAAANRAAFDLATTQDNLHAVNLSMNQRIEEAAGAIGHWEDRVSGVDEALGYLDEQLAAGNITTEEHGAAVEKLTDFKSRLQQGIEDDLIPAFIDEQLAAADLQVALDELDQKVKDGTLSQEEAAEQAAELRDEFEKQQNPVGTLIDKIGELIDILIDLEGQDPTVEITGDTSDAEAAVQRLKDMIASGAVLPVSISVGPTGGGIGGGGPFAAGTGPGAGVPRDMFALVGEEGPELAFLPQGTHIMPADETSKFLSLFGTLGGSLPGFADGTGSMGAGGVAVTGGEAAGEALGAQLSVGILRGISPIPPDALVDEAAIIAYVEGVWEQAVQAVEQVFVNNPVEIFSGEAGEALQEEIRAYEAFLEALLQAGFSADSPEYKEAYARYVELLRQLELITAVIGTESAEAFWEAFEETMEESAGVHAEGRRAPTPAMEEAAREMARAGLFALEEVLAEYPELVGDVIDDVLAAVEDGTLTYEEAMQILAAAGDEHLIPALERLEDKLSRDLVEAILEFGPDSPEVKAILDGLGLIEGALEDVAEQAGLTAEEIANMQDLSSQQESILGGGSGGGGGSPAPSSGGGGGAGSLGAGGGGRVGAFHAQGLPPGIRGLLSKDAGDVAKAAQVLGMMAELDGDSVTVTGDNIRFLQNLFRAVRDGTDALTSGKRIPDKGFTYSEAGTHFLTGEPFPAYINAFDQGGFTLGEGLALLHPNEAVLNPQAPMLKPLAEAIVAAIREQGGGAGLGDVNIYLDGRAITGAALTHLSRGAVTGQAVGS